MAQPARAPDFDVEGVRMLRVALPQDWEGVADNGGESRDLAEIRNVAVVGQTSVNLPRIQPSMKFLAPPGSGKGNGPALTRQPVAGRARIPREGRTTPISGRAGRRPWRRRWAQPDSCAATCAYPLAFKIANPSHEKPVICRQPEI
jgi:hypothetical protein